MTKIVNDLKKITKNTVLLRKRKTVASANKRIAKAKTESDKIFKNLKQEFFETVESAARKREESVTYNYHTEDENDPWKMAYDKMYEYATKQGFKCTWHSHFAGECSYIFYLEVSWKEKQNSDCSWCRDYSMGRR